MKLTVSLEQAASTTSLKRDMIIDAMAMVKFTPAEIGPGTKIIECPYLTN